MGIDDSHSRDDNATKRVPRAGWRDRHPQVRTPFASMLRVVQPAVRSGLRRDDEDSGHRKSITP
jgi:hypothetical protein